MEWQAKVTNGTQTGNAITVFVTYFKEGEEDIPRTHHFSGSTTNSEILKFIEKEKEELNKVASQVDEVKLLIGITI